MPLDADSDIGKLLAATDSIALVGASHKPERPSHRVMQFLLREGYRVFPVNPGLAGRRLLGRRVYPTLDAIPEPIDLVDVFRQSRFLAGIVEEAIAIGARAVWSQLDVIDLDAAARAEGAGLQVVMDRCPAIELPRLRKAGILPMS